MLHLDQEIHALTEKLLAMASYAETAVRRAIEAVTTRNRDLAAAVKEGDSVIDQFEVEVDEAAVRLLAKAPLGTDLRLIASTMKISQNLERVGDEACKIAKQARRLAEEPPLQLQLDIPGLSDKALRLLDASLDAFVNRQPTAARALIPQDKEIDALNKNIQQELTNLIIARSDTVTRALEYMTVARSLERIADHAKNIAEEVVYLCEAEDIRHTGKIPRPELAS